MEEVVTNELPFTKVQLRINFSEFSRNSSNFLSSRIFVGEKIGLPFSVSVLVISERFKTSSPSKLRPLPELKINPF